MIHTHSLGRAVRYYPERTAFASSEERSTFRELHDRVGRIAAALTNHGFRKGDRLGLFGIRRWLLQALSFLANSSSTRNHSTLGMTHFLRMSTTRMLYLHSSIPAGLRAGPKVWHSLIPTFWLIWTT